MSKKSLKVVELFAGVGGFREALDHGFSADAPAGFEFVWSNQWEPTESRRPPEEQSANRVYLEKFRDCGGEHYPDDIHTLTSAEGKLGGVPEKFDLLVGGFPCQDYSVAKPKNASKGIRGPKGVLWWSIERIVRERKPSYVLLENVDRLLGSPASNRGRDFAVILDGLLSEGYLVEWRVIDASLYGYPQRRRRVFIFACREGSPVAKMQALGKADARDVVLGGGVLAKAFPCEAKDGELSEFDFSSYDSDDDLGRRYSSPGGVSPFLAAGFAREKTAWSMRVEPAGKRPKHTLRDIVADAARTGAPANGADFLLKKDQVEAWRYAKGAKNEPRRKAVALKSCIRQVIREHGQEADPSTVDLIAGRLPVELGMDAELRVEHRGRSIKVRIAREELNQRVARELGLSGVRFDRPVPLERKQIDRAMRDPEAWERVEASMLSLAADRATTLVGTKDRVEREQLAQELRRPLKRALKELLERRVERIEGIRFDRDEVAGRSFAYGYKEGGMQFPDPLDAPGRTIITSEGGASVSRFKHVVCARCAAGSSGHKSSSDCVADGELRRLYPVELERMNGFGREHSKVCEKLKISAGRRAFFMGNALVVGLVRDIGTALLEVHRG